MPNVKSAVPTAGLAGFNALSTAEAEAQLLTCCASRTFARNVAALRPCRDLDQLGAAAAAAVRDLDWPDVREALSAHARIGEAPPASRPSPSTGDRGAERAGGAGRESSWSRQEQSGVIGAGQAVLDELAEGNRAYEERFGHIYLICATGLSAEEMLTRLRERLGNEDEAEREVVRAELAKITRLRVAKLMGERP
ncbi:2-oxo-4-hydroxy-4-carboxy-5-ureidoimidazoline decarboxylase [Streptosporangium sp. NPDC000396]|uniref:2-oxo-4-hydroxy-4-carboxy-5-ureidoimidazoline decarboxylase n=1 Tax=Streptosporangium sp. NPDC000396 TaxID=3366185 RepID=UPI00368CCF4C